MKTIEVIFTNTRRDPKVTDTKYLYLCKDPKVCVGDLITDNRYSTKLLVINIYNRNNAIQNGYILKTVCIDMIERQPRNISITLEQAREWYFGDNKTLKTLALSAYNESEICNSYDYICQHINTSFNTLLVPFQDKNTFTSLAKLSAIAAYYNGSWIKTECNTGYFLGKSNINVNATSTFRKNIYIFRHDNVKYPGIVYFKNKEDVIEALHMLNKEDLDNLF